MPELKTFAVANHWPGEFDEAGIVSWAKALRQKLDAPRVSLGLVFMTPRYFEKAAATLELLRLHAQIPLLMGCSSNSLIVHNQEVEETEGIVLGLYYLPGAELTPFHFDEQQVEGADDPAFWPEQTGITGARSNGWLVFADPFHLDGEAWLRSWNVAYAPLPVVGGLASGEATEQRTQLYLNAEVFEEGGIALSVGGDVQLRSVISQGCTPIGELWTITKTERNLIYQIGNRPAYEILVQTFNQLSPEEQQKTRGNLFVGLVINEYLEEFHRGDFLIRNLLGADPQSGALAVGAFPRTGQTLQFQRRDAGAATQDMEALLGKARLELADQTIYGACLCCCNGRGVRLFGEPNHDAAHVQRFLGPLGLTGFFCNGELGPVGERNFLHGYTASLALFVRK